MSEGKLPVMRARIFRLGESAMELLLSATREVSHGQMVCLPFLHHDDLPSDALLTRVGHDMWTKTFTLMFEHESFEDVADGLTPPEPSVCLLNVRIVKLDYNPDCSALIVPIMTQTCLFNRQSLRDMFYGILTKIGVKYAANASDSRRWSFSDLATDLADEMKLLLNDGDKLP